MKGERTGASAPATWDPLEAMPHEPPVYAIPADADLAAAARHMPMAALVRAARYTTRTGDVAAREILRRLDAREHGAEDLGAIVRGMGMWATSDGRRGEAWRLAAERLTGPGSMA